MVSVPKPVGQRAQRGIGEDGRDGQVGMPLRHTLEMVDEIKIAGLTVTPGASGGKFW